MQRRKCSLVKIAHCMNLKRWSAILPPAHWSWPKEVERLHEPKKRDPGSNRALRKPRIVPYRKLPVVTLTSFPIDSPDTTSSTRRFSCRPAELSFEATGSVLPNPVAVIEFVDTPCCTR